ncbi:MAG TPA: IclR family transcriptional regulator [Euzebya sp.]|nr:IclR family transcriptional regulator [Euzebya sp.]
MVGAFGPDDESLGLSEITRRSGVPKASVYRLVQELLDWGFLERRGVGYGLGLRLFELGQRVPQQRILREAARPFMEDLLQSTRATIHLAVRDGLDVLYVEKVAGHNEVSYPSRLAGRMPLHCTEVLLAHSSRSLVAELLARPLEQVTPYTVTQPAVLVEELAKVRAVGYAAEHEQTRVGFMSVASPLVSATGTVVGALAITKPVNRAEVPRLVAMLRTASHGITQSITLRHMRRADVRHP